MAARKGVVVVTTLAGRPSTRAGRQQYPADRGRPPESRRAIFLEQRIGQTETLPGALWPAHWPPPFSESDSRQDTVSRRRIGRPCTAPSSRSGPRSFQADTCVRGPVDLLAPDGVVDVQTDFPGRSPVRIGRLPSVRSSAAPSPVAYGCVAVRLRRTVRRRRRENETDFIVPGAAQSSAALVRASHVVKFPQSRAAGSSPAALAEHLVVGDVRRPTVRGGHGRVKGFVGRRRATAAGRCRRFVSVRFLNAFVASSSGGTRRFGEVGTSSSTHSTHSGGLDQPAVAALDQPLSFRSTA